MMNRFSTGQECTISFVCIRSLFLWFDPLCYSGERGIYFMHLKSTKTTNNVASREKNSPDKNVQSGDYGGSDGGSDSGDEVEKGGGWW